MIMNLHTLFHKQKTILDSITISLCYASFCTEFIHALSLFISHIILCLPVRHGYTYVISKQHHL
jgi:hypothetical protein